MDTESYPTCIRIEQDLETLAYGAGNDKEQRGAACVDQGIEMIQRREDGEGARGEDSRKEQAEKDGTHSRSADGEGSSLRALYK
jgi:hypothetical protein